MLLIESLILFIGVASATTVQAWNGNTCDGSAGGVVTLSRNGNCVGLGGRHSFEADGDNVKGYYYSSSGCQGASTYFTSSNGACRNINTGGPVGSMCVVGKSLSSLWCIWVPLTQI